MTENEKPNVNETERNLKREIVLTNLRWQVVILAINYILPLRFIRYGDPWVDGIVGFLMNSAIGLGGSALLYLFFTKFSEGKFLSNQRKISLVVSLLVVVTSWNRYS
jgi:hypothetical protein